VVYLILDWKSADSAMNFWEMGKGKAQVAAWHAVDTKLTFIDDRGYKSK
jgi:hypothetical protein